MESHYFECDCGSSEHTLKFILDPDTGEIYTEVQLVKQSLLKRVWCALKYIFGHECKYGHWDCWNMREEDNKRLLILLEKSSEIRSKNV